MNRSGETVDTRNAMMREIILMRIASILKDVYKDPASDLSEETIFAKLAFKSHPQLNELRLALERMGRGEFGRCIFCKGPISTGVLERNPTAHFCDQCAGMLRHRTMIPRGGYHRPSSEKKASLLPKNSTSISG